MQYRSSSTYTTVDVYMSDLVNDTYFSLGTMDKTDTASNDSPTYIPDGKNVILYGDNKRIVLSPDGIVSSASPSPSTASSIQLANGDYAVFTASGNVTSVYRATKSGVSLVTDIDFGAPPSGTYNSSNICCCTSDGSIALFRETSTRTAYVMCCISPASLAVIKAPVQVTHTAVASYSSKLALYDAANDVCLLYSYTQGQQGAVANGSGTVLPTVAQTASGNALGARRQAAVPSAVSPAYTENFVQITQTGKRIGLVPSPTIAAYDFSGIDLVDGGNEVVATVAASSISEFSLARGKMDANGHFFGRQVGSSGDGGTYLGVFFEFKLP
jgi:hypothetical protein